jgi:hypothetical protein
MIKIQVRADPNPAIKGIEKLERQIPYATAQAINNLAFRVQNAERINIAKTFAHPRPFTVRSVLVDKASKSDLSATIYVRPEVAKYLAPYETGGMHVLPGRGIAMLDPVNVTLDQYGQLRRGTTTRLKARANTFVGPVQTRAGIVNGFWQRLKDKQGARLKLLIRFSDNKPVNEHLGFASLAESLVRAGWSKAFADAMDKAAATAQ